MADEPIQAPALDPGPSVLEARAMKAKWGTARVQGERTICVREDENKAVFISRGGLVECLY